MSQPKEFVDLFKLPKPQARVLIAEDVLLQIKAARIQVKERSYLTWSWMDGLPDLNAPLHEVLEQKICKVCALGALCYSKIQIANHLLCKDVGLWGSYMQWSSVFDQLTPYFESVYRKRQ